MFSVTFILSSANAFNLGKPNILSSGEGLTHNKFLDQSKLKAFADDKLTFAENLKFVMDIARKYCGKRGKCCLPAFSPFFTVFSKGVYFRVDKSKSRDCVVELTTKANNFVRGASGVKCCSSAY